MSDQPLRPTKPEGAVGAGSSEPKTPLRPTQKEQGASGPLPTKAERVVQPENDDDFNDHMETGIHRTHKEELPVRDTLAPVTPLRRTTQESAAPSAGASASAPRPTTKEQIVAAGQPGVRLTEKELIPVGESLSHPPVAPTLREPAASSQTRLSGQSQPRPTKPERVVPPTPPPSASRQSKTPAGDSPVYRPKHRAPMAVLCILDDGATTGEMIRIRQNQTVIGRVEGDVILSDDNGISGKHAEIVRVFQDGQWQWILRDLNSRNGVFVRTASSLLRSGTFFIAGSTRFQYRETQGAPSAPQAAEVQATRAWQATGPLAPTPVMVRKLTEYPDGLPQREIVLDKDELVMGRDAKSCSIVIDRDPYIGLAHAKLVREEEGTRIYDLKSVNGLWVKVGEQPIRKSCEFFLGEQRFVLKVMG